ncbi:MAG: hypothetical protein Q9159_003149 [Coniocarpon cinnabarinum]
MASVTTLHPTHTVPPIVPAAQEPHATLPTVAPQTGFIPRGPVRATLNFFKPPQDGSKPFNFVETPPEGQPQRNFPDEDAEVSISDARGRESEFHLDRHAFQALSGYPHNPAINWEDDDSIKRVYYPEVERLLKEHTGGNRVLLFDHTIRRAAPNAHRGPVNRAHIDQTSFSAKQRVEFHLPDEAPELLKGRYRIINVWRPLNGAVESHPLAFADSSSVPQGDIVPIEHRYPTRTGETAGVKFNGAHQWWYLSGIGNDERLMLQCYDSQAMQNRVPHSAFVDPRSTEASKPRESIEVRALVFG